MFVPFDARAYRALDADQFEERRSLVIDLLGAEELPDGVTTDQLIAERDLILSEVELRNAQAQVRAAKVASVASGAGTVTATYGQSGKPQGRSAEDMTDSEQYRNAFMRYAQGKVSIEQFRTLTPVAVDGTYTSEDDYSVTYEQKVAVPATMGREIVRKLDEYGHIYPLVRKMSIKGGLWFRVKDLTLEALWIDDKHVSPYQEDTDGDKVTFSYHQLECRFAQTLLASAVTWEDFQSMFVDAVSKAMVKAIEQAIIRGSGSGQPLGITVDPRVVGVRNQAGTGWTTEPLGTVIEVTAADVDDWQFWHKLPFMIPRLYRSQGTWLMGDSTWGTHIDVLKDDNNSPIGKYSAINDEERLSILGRRVELVEDAILPGFDEASVGDVFAIYGDLSNYVLNTQPGMPLSTVQWTDHETNQLKIKSLVALDGKVLDPYGFVVLKKKASA